MYVTISFRVNSQDNCELLLPPQTKRMSTVNFYLKKKEASTGKSLIFLQYKYNGRRLVYSFGQAIDPDNWNKKKQRVKANGQTTVDGQHLLNELLDNLEEVCKTAYYTEIKNGIPEPAVLKEHLNEFLKKNHEPPKQKVTLYQLIGRFINNEITDQGKGRSKATLTIYGTTLKHLQDFERAERYPIDFDTITLEFFHRFVAYLKGKGMMQNTIHKYIKSLKTFMGEAVDLHYTDNKAFRQKKFAIKPEDSESVYLREEELIKLWEFKLENKRLTPIKDLFIFGSFTGLRFSDFSRVQPENIIQEDGDVYLKVKTKKTGEMIYVPCHPLVLQIFEKYSDRANRLPKAISNQRFNEYIKEVCEAAGMKEKGRLLNDPDKPLYECITSHTARRSFATNWYLKGYEPRELMKITGHRTEKAFMKYIRVSKFESAKQLGKRMKESWQNRVLRIAG